MSKRKTSSLPEQATARKRASGEKEYDARLWDGDNFFGTYVVYEATPHGASGFVCDVEIDSLRERNIRETRAAITRAASRRAPPATRLNEELAVIFGPGLSAKDAVRSLRRVAASIEKDGLLIGRAEDAGDYLIEDIYGEVTS